MEVLDLSIDNSDIFKNVPVNVPVNVPAKLIEREAKIANEIRRNPSITISDLTQLLSVNDKTIKRDISSLKSKGLLTRIGSDKSGERKVLE